ncbi:MAG: hypothetical protein ACO26F_08840 [Burkholderiaceae bacterium]|jgi:hypothetical protein
MNARRRPVSTVVAAAVLSLVGSLGSLAWAQSVSPNPPRSNAPPWSPDDAQAPVPPVVHRSALRAFAADPVPVGSWVNANRLVDELGGWRAYLKEAHGMPQSSAAKPK